MNLFGSKHDEPADVAPFDEWKVRAELPNGKFFEMNGHAFSWTDHNQVVKVAEAMADGLRRGGFPAEVLLIRKSAERRA